MTSSLGTPLLDGHSDGEAASASSSSAAAPASSSSAAAPPPPVPEGLAGVVGAKKKKKKPPITPLQAHIRTLHERLTKKEPIDKKELAEVHKGLLKYKNRWLDAPVLHFAVAHWSADTVKHILELNGRVDAKACYKYTKKSEPLRANGEPQEKVQHVSLEAIHVAAGLGKTGALEVLLEYERELHPDRPDRREYPEANIFCHIQEGAQDHHGRHAPGDFRRFYTPLHDAAWFGQKGTIKELMKAKADVTMPNKDGKTALHLLVQAGHAGHGDDEIEDLLKTLLDVDDETKKEMLNAKTEDDIMPVAQRNLTPLELAAASQFPPHLMHHLIGAESAIEGMLRLARISMSATEAFANQIAEHDKFEVLYGCQHKHAVDKMATLLFKAPTAAVRMLNMLTVDPFIADPQHWPIPCSAVVKASPNSMAAMKCQYRCDNKLRSCKDFHDKDHRAPHNNSDTRKLRWPSWNFNSESFEPEAWHQELVCRVPENSEPCECVEDVRVKAVLLPGIVNVDILWALARARPKDYKIFARLAVRGVITCVWHGIVERVYWMNVSWRCLEQLALVYWGFMTHVDVEAEEEANQRAPFILILIWALLLAAVIRELAELLLWVYCHYTKMCQYQSTGLGGAVVGRRKTIMQQAESILKQTLRMSPEEAVQWQSLWSLSSLLCSWDTCFFGHVSVTLSLLLFLICESGLLSWGLVYGEEQLRRASVLLSFIVCLRFWGLLYMLRVCSLFGKNLVTACNSLFSVSMFKMAFTMCFIFCSIWCTFVIMVGQTHRSGWVGLYLYRALIFGDGDGLENLGLSPDPEEGESEFHHTVMTFSMAAFGGFFQLVVLNLIVSPVYGSEYEGIQQEADLVLQRARAGYIVMYLMSRRPRHWVYETIDQFCKDNFGDETLTMRGAFCSFAAAMLVVGLLLPVLKPNPITVVIAAICIAVCQASLNAAFMHSSWIGDIAGAGDDKHTDGQSSGTLLDEDAQGEVGVQAEEQRGGSTVASGDPFLWMCYRKDYNEEWCVQNDPIDKGVIENLSDKIDTEMQSLREELQRLEGLLHQNLQQSPGQL